MADVIYDVVKGVRDHLQGLLPVNKVKLSYQDERSDDESERNYPEATLTIFRSEFDSKRRTGAARVVALKPLETPPIAEITRPPIPVNLFFQLDTYALLRTEDWNIAEAAHQILGARFTKITTDGNRILHLIPETMDTLDNLTGNSMFRKAYRFYVKIWFDDIRAAENLYLVLTHNLDMNETLMTLNSVA